MTRFTPWTQRNKTISNSLIMKSLSITTKKKLQIEIDHVQYNISICVYVSVCGTTVSNWIKHGVLYTRNNGIRLFLFEITKKTCNYLSLSIASARLPFIVWIVTLRCVRSIATMFINAFFFFNCFSLNKTVDMRIKSEINCLPWDLKCIHSTLDCCFFYNVLNKNQCWRKNFAK